MNRDRTVMICAFCMASLVATCVQAEDRRVSDAIASGLAYLAAQQNLDGSFETEGPRMCDTGLSLLAFLSTANTSGGGRYATNVRRATEFLLRQAPSDRNFGNADESGSNGQAIVTLALCEAYGVEPEDIARARIRAMAKDAVAVLLASKDRGAWRAASFYAAQQIGLPIPNAATTSPTTAPAEFAELSASAMDQLLASQLSDGSWPAPGGADSSARIAETARAVFSLGRRLGVMPFITPAVSSTPPRAAQTSR